jgi:hypothetical protein
MARHFTLLPIPMRTTISAGFSLTVATRETNAYPAPGNFTAPFTNIVNNANFTGGPLVFTGVANRKGDDDDKKRLAGGSSQNPSGTVLSYIKFPMDQHEMAFRRSRAFKRTLISDLIANDDEVLLIITINNDSLDGDDSLCQLMKDDYNLHLYHNNPNISYDHINHRGVNQSSFPSGDEQYFEFANHPG